MLDALIFLNEEELKNDNISVELGRQGYLLVFNLGISLLCLHRLPALMDSNLCWTPGTHFLFLCCLCEPLERFADVIKKGMCSLAEL